MKWTEALTEMINGNRVRLPEWIGYWFVDRNAKIIMAFTRTGNTVRAELDKFIQRDDWQVVTEGLGFDWALLSFKNGKAIRREEWPNDWFIVLSGTDWLMKFDDKKKSLDLDDIMATDWVLA